MAQNQLALDAIPGPTEVIMAPTTYSPLALAPEQHRDQEGFLQDFLANGTPAKEAVSEQGTVKLTSTGVDIAYQVFRTQAPGPLHKRVAELSECSSADSTPKHHSSADTTPRHQEATAEQKLNKVLLIMGFAAGGDAWLPFIHKVTQIMGQQAGQLPSAAALELCAYDNRGIGASSIPPHKSSYTTTLMAADAIGLMDHLGWYGPVHVVGFSMGGMIASKLAAMQPNRVASLTLLSVTGGGAQIIPLSWSAIKHGLRGIADKSDHGRATADVKFHFSTALRRTSTVDGRKLGHVLVEEYVESSRLYGRQQPAGEAGHFNACWTHRVTEEDVQEIHAGGFPIRLIHGQHDLIAKPKHAAKLARRLGAPLLLMDGGHFIVRENAEEVAHVVLNTVHGGGVQLLAGSAQVASPGETSCLCCCCCF